MSNCAGGLPHRVRAILFTLSCIGIWCIFSLSPILENRPSDFQAAGSVIVAWSILFLAREKSKKERSLAIANRNVLISGLERLEAHRKIADERLNITFDVHMLQIAQVSRKVGVPNPSGAETDSEIVGLSQSIQERVSDREFIESPKEEMMFRRDIQRLKEMDGALVPWLNVVTRHEVFFLIFGTIQWGYGDRWVQWFHS